MTEIIVLKPSGKFKEKISGTYKEGKFVFQTGILSYIMMGTDNELAYDPSLLGEYDTAQYINDGKDFFQIDLRNKKFETKSTMDYTTFIKQGVLAKEVAITKPADNTKLLQFGMWILILITAGLVYLTVNNIGSQFATAVKPMQNITNQNNLLNAQNHNDTIRLANLYNQTIQMCKFNALRGG